MELDDLSIDDLLAAISTKPKRSYTEPKDESSTELMELPCTLRCKNCGTVYHTIAIRPKKWYDTYKRLDYDPFFCPKCITVENWLEHFYTAKPIEI